MRQKICDYLADNKPIIEDLPTDFVLSLDDNKNYIKNMRKSSQWGGAIEIKAACNMWKLRIIVQNNRDSSARLIEFLPINGKYKYTVIIGWNGYHYVPIDITKET